jgi:endonuclease YncB( thermonuclease family)
MDREQRISQWLRWRRVLRIGAVVVFVLLVGLIVLDHTRAFGYSGNDLRRFDHRSVVVTRAIDGDTICVKGPGDASETTVHLLGVDAPDLPANHWAEQAAKYTTARTVGRTVTLHLDPIGWRNDRGELLAYVFITDADNLNADIVHDGQAYADRRTTHSLHAAFEVAEKDARTKKRGLWKELADDQMPAWRRAWLRSRGY